MSYPTDGRSVSQSAALLVPRAAGPTSYTSIGNQYERSVIGPKIPFTPSPYEAIPRATDHPSDLEQKVAALQDVIVGLALKKQNPVLKRVLPLLKTELDEIQYNIWTYNQAPVGRVPYEGVVRNLTSQRQALTDVLHRNGIGFKIEWSLLNQPGGTEYYRNMLTNTAISWIETLALDAIIALLGAPTYPRFQRAVMAKFGTVRSRIEEMEIRSFNCLSHVDQREFATQVERHIQELRKLGEDPNAIIVPPGLTMTLSLGLDKMTRYSEMGPAGPKTFFDGPDGLTTYRGLEVIEMNELNLGPDDKRMFSSMPLLRRIAIGEINEMNPVANMDGNIDPDYRTNHASIYIYSSETDNFAKISFKNAVDHSRLFDADTERFLGGLAGRPPGPGSDHFRLYNDDNGRVQVASYFGLMEPHHLTRNTVRTIAGLVTRRVNQLRGENGHTRAARVVELLHDMEEEPYDHEFFRRLIEVNLPKSMRGAAFEGSVMPDALAEKWNVPADLRFKEWEHNRFGSLDLPRKNDRMKCKSPPGYANGPGLLTVAEESAHPDSGWHHIGVRARDAVEFLTDVIAEVSLCFPTSPYVDPDNRDPWFHVPSIMAVVVADLLTGPRHPMFLPALHPRHTPLREGSVFEGLTVPGGAVPGREETEAAIKTTIDTENAAIRAHNIAHPDTPRNYISLEDAIAGMYDVRVRDRVHAAIQLDGARAAAYLASARDFRDRTIAISARDEANNASTVVVQVNGIPVLGAFSGEGAAPIGSINMATAVVRNDGDLYLNMLSQVYAAYLRGVAPAPVGLGLTFTAVTTTARTITSIMEAAARKRFVEGLYYLVIDGYNGKKTALDPAARARFITQFIATSAAEGLDKGAIKTLISYAKERRPDGTAEPGGVALDAAINAYGGVIQDPAAAPRGHIAAHSVNRQVGTIIDALHTTLAEIQRVSGVPIKKILKYVDNNDDTKLANTIYTIMAVLARRHSFTYMPTATLAGTAAPNGIDATAVIRRALLGNRRGTALTTGTEYPELANFDNYNDGGRLVPRNMLNAIGAQLAVAVSVRPITAISGDARVRAAVDHLVEDLYRTVFNAARDIGAADDIALFNVIQNTNQKRRAAEQSELVDFDDNPTEARFYRSPLTMTEKLLQTCITADRTSLILPADPRSMCAIPLMDWLSVHDAPRLLPILLNDAAYKPVATVASRLHAHVSHSNHSFNRSHEARNRDAKRARVGEDLAHVASRAPHVDQRSRGERARKGPIAERTRRYADELVGRVDYTEFSTMRCSNFVDRWKDIQDIPDNLEKIVAMIFVTSAFNRVQIEAMLENNVPVPFAIWLWRLGITYDMYSCIVTSSRGDVGNTFVKEIDLMTSIDGATKVVQANFTAKAKPVVLNPNKVITINNVKSGGYVGGDGIKTVTSGEFVFSNAADKQQDIIYTAVSLNDTLQVPVPVSWTGSITYPTSDSTSDRKETRWSTREAYEAIYHLEESTRGADRPDDFSASSYFGYNGRPNLFAYPGLQLRFNPVTRLFDIARECEGHRRGGVGPGTRKIYNGAINVFEKMPPWTEFRLS